MRSEGRGTVQFSRHQDGFGCDTAGAALDRGRYGFQREDMWRAASGLLELPPGVDPLDLFCGGDDGCADAGQVEWSWPPLLAPLAAAARKAAGSALRRMAGAF